MIPGSANPLLLKSAAAAGGYQVERSLRFNSSDSAYCGRTFTTPTTQGTFTFAAWIKRAALGTTQNLFGVSTNHSFGFTSGNALNLTFAGSSALTTTALFRDSSAWYHIVWTQSGTSHTLYVNNVSVGTATATSSVFNTAVAHQIGAANTANYFNGYLADIHFIDGQALTPSSFTEVSATTGQLIPKAYSGSFGTNGFWLKFSDNSAATAAALGKDYSGNSNNWTPNNLSVTAGAGNDSLVDTPTSYGTDTGVGGEVRGNYSVLNALTGGGTLSNGNLDFTGATGGVQRYGTIGVSSGKWYWEAAVTAGSGSSLPLIGIGSNPNQSGLVGIYGYYGFNGNKYADSTATSYGASYGVNDVIGIAFDADNGTITFYKNGSTQGQAYSGITGTYFPYLRADGGTSVVVNFGQRPFAYTAPSGFKALCDTNLPAPVVAKPSEVMDVALYTGNGGNQSITLPGGFNPDLVWVKSRSNSQDHYLFDAVRGGASILRSNTTGAESTGTTYLSFDTSGFSSLNGLSSNGYTYAAWTWDAGSSTVTNTQGSITSTVSVRANASAGFSVVTYTGTGVNCTVGHGLNVAPSLIIVKSRSVANDWAVYHAANTSDPKTDYLLLNSTAATADDNTYWNDTAPTSTVFSIGTNADVNTNGTTYVAYCWAPLVGYSSMGSYVGNGSADGPFIFTSFRPRWIMIKRSSSAGSGGNWIIKDALRYGYNDNLRNLYANLSAAEESFYSFDILSNGFKIRSTDVDINGSAATYIYAAFAENPFQFSRAR